MPELQELQGSWADYWETASCHWAALLETFRKGGDWQSLKQVGEILEDDDILYT